MQGKKRIWIAMSLLFVSGVAVGFFGTGLVLRRQVNEFVGRSPAGMHSRVVHRALKDLDLTADQRRDIDLIIEETDPKLRRLAEGMRETMDSTLAEQHDRIKTILTGEQRAEFERRLEEMRRRFEQMRDRRPPHGHRTRGGFREQDDRP
ncbi:MAG: hypothetical protein PHQ19_06550 [Candidatus Krumholzibacteria bacterium]|nr:hypothetical protein [Candidatus Krumholzibacteria bacterium]